MLGYGWCNYLLEVRVSQNTIGILLVNAANNVNVVNAIVEANYGAGIVLLSGYQVNLEGNVIEGNKGPAIVASSMYAMTVQSHYFESNNEYGTLHRARLEPEHSQHDLHHRIHRGSLRRSRYQREPSFYWRRRRCGRAAWLCSRSYNQREHMLLARPTTGQWCVLYYHVSFELYGAPIL
jgi:hypothetical protein